MGGHSVAAVVLVGLLAVASNGQGADDPPANYQLTDTSACPVPNEPVCLNGVPPVDVTAVEVYDLNGIKGVQLTSPYATVEHYAPTQGNARVIVTLTQLGMDTIHDTYPGLPYNAFGSRNRLQSAGCKVVIKDDYAAGYELTTWIKDNLDFQRCPATKAPPPTTGDSSWETIWISMATVGGIYIVVGIAWAVATTK